METRSHAAARQRFERMEAAVAAAFPHLYRTRAALLATVEELEADFDRLHEIHALEPYSRECTRCDRYEHWQNYVPHDDCADKICSVCADELDTLEERWAPRQDQSTVEPLPSDPEGGCGGSDQVGADSTNEATMEGMSDEE